MKKKKLHYGILYKYLTEKDYTLVTNSAFCAEKNWETLIRERAFITNNKVKVLLLDKYLKPKIKFHTSKLKLDSP